MTHGRGTRHKVNMNLAIEKPIWGDSLLLFSHDYFILQTLDQILLLKGNFSSVGLLGTSSVTLLVIRQDKLVCSQGQAEFVPGLLKMLLQCQSSP